MESANYPCRARHIAYEYCVHELGLDVDKSDLYVVWFVKTLHHWKALVSTDATEGLYLELTYDGIQDHTYVDQYAKQNQIVVYKGDTQK